MNPTLKLTLTADLRVGNVRLYTKEGRLHLRYDPHITHATPITLPKDPGDLRRLAAVLYDSANLLDGTK